MVIKSQDIAIKSHYMHVSREKITMLDLVVINNLLFYYSVHTRCFIPINCSVSKLSQSKVCLNRMRAEIFVYIAFAPVAQW